ncbi:C40 family peptidase [Pokkaliibacter sp. CJK22405]|uniref:C40 family peptidase n=1 Tax=Pokkaliibacter sp. CJK22405 TaxID=3384615 RepID=UPI00398525BE
MRQRFLPLLVILCSVTLAACSSNGTRPSTSAAAETDIYGDAAIAADQEATDSLTDGSDAIDYDVTKRDKPALPGSDYQLGGPTVNRVLQEALSLKGTPYQWGGTTPDSGFDCSGFLNYVYNEAAGIELPRTTRELIRMPMAKIARTSLKPGDLVFFSANGRGRVSHVGIYLGGNKFIHSNHSGGSVRIDNLRTSYWQKTYLEAKRVIASGS